MVHEKIGLAGLLRNRANDGPNVIREMIDTVLESKKEEQGEEMNYRDCGENGKIRHVMSHFVFVHTLFEIISCGI